MSLIHLYTFDNVCKIIKMTVHCEVDGVTLIVIIFSSNFFVLFLYITPFFTNYKLMSVMNALFSTLQTYVPHKMVGLTLISLNKKINVTKRVLRTFLLWVFLGGNSTQNKLMCKKIWLRSHRHSTHYYKLNFIIYIHSINYVYGQYYRVHTSLIQWTENVNFLL